MPRFCLILVLNLLVISGFSQDYEKPEPPDIKSVSVDTATGHVNIKWRLSISPDVWGYLVYRNYGSLSSPIWIGASDTIESPYADSLLDIGAQANSKSESYRIIAIDSAKNASLMSPMHSTMYSFPYLNDKECPPHIQLSWSPYDGWGDSLSHYEVYVQEFPGSFVLLDSVNNLENTYNHYSISDLITYCYFTRAIHKDGLRASISNVTCAEPELYTKPQFLNANFVTVDNYNSVKASFSIDEAAESIEGYYILRSNSETGIFDTLKRFDPNSGPVLDYSDVVNIVRDSYSYKMVALDYCYEPTITSNTGNNIILNVESTDIAAIYLNWTHYKSFRGGVNSYNIYRMTDYSPPELINTVSQEDTVYYDDLSVFAQTRTEGDFCYYIEAVEGSNPYYNGAKSRSNVICSSVGPIVYMPNAFTPGGDGKNDVFLPYISFASPKSYSFIVYDRWGHILFRTDNSTEGWNGKTTRGEMAKMGCYIYYINFITSENKIYEKAGSFTLISN